LLKINIPGSGLVSVKHLVTDFTGTLSFDGKLIPGVKERLSKLSESLLVHVLTSDTFGTARTELIDIDCDIHVLEGDAHGQQKKAYVEELGPGSVIAFGNGRNDQEMLETAGIGVAVIGSEGGAVAAVTSADLAIVSIIDGLDLLLFPRRLIATLRR
jgi:P-type E1-E2 ATPase